MVDLATKSLLHDKLRFLITVSGVAFAVTLVFVQVGLFLGLMDNLGKCLRAGTKLQANRQSLRAALADALYQRLHAPAAAPAVEAAKK